MKTSIRRGKSAFTLIELMAVITIIVILAGLVVGGLGFVTERQAKEKARVQMALLSKALEEYKLDMGYYPSTGNLAGPFTNSTGTGTSSILYTTLFLEGYDYTKNATPPTTWDNKSTRIYVESLNPITSKQGWVTTATSIPTGAFVLDPWGNQYCYRAAQSVNVSTGAATANADTQNPDFDLWSMGKDGKSTPGTPADTTNRDDIKNF